MIRFGLDLATEAGMAGEDISVKKYVVRLSAGEREHVQALIRKGKSPAKRLLKARILLKADVSEAGEGWSDSRIIQALDTSASMIYRVRKQLVEEGFEAVLSRKRRMTPPVAAIFDGRDAVMSKKRDRAELEARRLEGAHLLQRGTKPAEVARRLQVSRTSVWRWGQALDANGRRALRKAPRTGRPPQLTDAEKKRLVVALEAGALVQGYATDLWTLSRVGKLIEKISGKRYSESGVWRLLKGLNFSCQRPSGRAIKRDEQAIRHWKTKRWPTLKKLRQTRPNHRLHR